MTIAGAAREADTLAAWPIPVAMSIPAVAEAASASGRPRSSPALPAGSDAPEAAGRRRREQTNVPGVRLGPVRRSSRPTRRARRPLGVLGLLGSRPRPESRRGNLTHSAWLWSNKESSGVADTRRNVHPGQRAGRRACGGRVGLWSSSVVTGPPSSERRPGGRRPEASRADERTRGTPRAGSPFIPADVSGPPASGRPRAARVSATPREPSMRRGRSLAKIE